MAKETYTREEVKELINLADDIIGPAQDILPETYDEELEAYYKWTENNFKQ